MWSWSGRGDDPIYSPPPQKEKRGKEEEEASGKKRLPAQPLFVLARELGAGTYNCTFLLDNGHEVLRVGYLLKSDEESKKTVLRGLEVVHVFQSFGGMLGPSLLRELSNYRVVAESELSQHVRGTLCEKIRESQARHTETIDTNEFALQHLEFLSGGSFDNATYTELKFTAEELCFSVFSLVWFFASAQQYFSFRHHDLKSANLMVRNTDTAHAYHFTLTGTSRRHQYRFKSHLVPVVIDFDFSTVYTSKSLDDRNVGGTRYTCSPDACIYLIHEHNKMSPVKYADDAYDWWSLGICILELLFQPPPSIWNAFSAHAKSFVGNALEQMTALRFERRAYNAEMLNTLFRSCCFAAVVADSSIRPPPTAAYGPIAENSAVWDGWDERVRGDPDFQRVRNTLRGMDADLQALMGRLLAWDPKERNASNYPMNLILQSPYFAKFKVSTAAEPTDHAYSGTTKKILEDKHYLDDIRVKDHPFLALQICSECVGGTQLYMCECCAQVYCSEDCQRKTHL